MMQLLRKTKRLLAAFALLPAIGLAGPSEAQPSGTDSDTDDGSPSGSSIGSPLGGIYDVVPDPTIPPWGGDRNLLAKPVPTPQGATSSAQAAAMGDASAPIYDQAPDGGLLDPAILALKEKWANAVPDSGISPDPGDARAAYAVPEIERPPDPDQYEAFEEYRERQATPVEEPQTTVTGDTHSETSGSTTSDTENTDTEGRPDDQTRPTE